MSNLKDLVPPLELCKKIPAGEFADSALMCEAMIGMASRQVLDIRIIPRQKITNNPYVDRKLGREYYIYPAPTLQEILEKLPRTVKLDFWGDEFHIYNDVPNGYGVSNKTPATAALKLWLQLSDKSELSDT